MMVRLRWCKILLMVDAMAANSGGVEWSSIIKPIVSPYTYSSVNKYDLLELCSAINKSGSEILHHKDSFKVFYNSFAILAADYINVNSSSLAVNHMDVVCNACRVLLKYLINSLHALSTEPVPNTAQAIKLLNAIKSLCLGTGVLSSADQATLIQTMKNENLPPHIKANPTAVSEKETTTKSESVKPRSDLSTSIFEKLTLPLREGQSSLQPGQDSEIIKLIITDQSTSSDVSSEIKKLCCSTNIESLQGLKASDILLDLCLNLASIKRSKTKCDEALAGKPFSLPTTYSEATAIRNSLPSVVADINVAFCAISLPILEPLNPTKLEKLNELCMSILYCAVLQASACSVLGMGSAVSPKNTNSQQSSSTTASNKEEDYDSLAATVVEKALHMFTYIGNTIKNSTRAGGHVYLNLILAGAWVVLSGLQTQLSISTAPSIDKEKGEKVRDDKGRSPSKSRETNTSRVSLMKVQQGFGVLLVALSTRALKLMEELLDDLHLEICGGAVAPTQIEPAPLRINEQPTALQRTVRLLGTVPLNQLLFYLATITYRKACTLKRIQKHPPEGDTFSQSDSTTYYEDMIMCSDESSTDDDDSEPILGQWFEETLAPPENTENNTVINNSEEEKPATTDRTQSIVPEKGEPHGYISLATEIFNFMNKHLLTTKSGFITRYIKAGLTEQQMIILAAIIRDLDRETARTESGTISVYFGSVLGQLYSEFSGALTKYTHNLVTHSALGSLHASLLNHLGISPWNVDIPHAWPLQVYPRTLAVLAQVLLLRPQQEKEASIISIWRRLVNTLVENVINPASMSKEQDGETGDDLNVEHAQVLLYLFHSLNLMQKKSVLLLTAGGVVRGSEVARGPLKDSQLLHLSRLLLLLDYIMKHLYDAPPTLLEQIHWNMFTSTNLTSDQDRKESNVSRMYTQWLDLEENYRKHSNSDEFAMKPRFYAITNMDFNNQDVPKLDGLACNFILGTPDKLRYPLLLDALIEILNVTHVTSSVKLSYLGLCATQYCFTICWRLLLMLPPSTPYMDRLSSGENIPAGLLLLHTLVWGKRASHKIFSRWLKDCLVKQGMYTQYTEKLLKAVSDSVNNLKYDISIARNCVISLTPDVKLNSPMKKDDLPPLWHIFLLNSVMAKVQLSLIDDEWSTESTLNALIEDFLPHVLKLTEAILHCNCISFMYQVSEHNETTGKLPNEAELMLLHNLLSVCSPHNTRLSTDLLRHLPANICSILENWNTVFLENCTLTPFLNDIITSESYILSIVNAHVSTLSTNPIFKINLSLKQLLQDLVKFICQYAPKIENVEIKNKSLQLLSILSLDARTEFIHENVQKTLDKMVGNLDNEEQQKKELI